MFMRKLSSLFRVSGTVTRCLTTGKTQIVNNYPHPSVLISAYQNVISESTLIKNHRPSILDLPLPWNPLVQEVPKIITPIEDKINPNVIEDPTKVIEYRAERLIIIRKKKMKKHKLKKLRKKMKYIWAKVRQKREMRKEKAFQAELMGQISEANKFDATLYAKEKLNKANEFVLPEIWKGKRYPDFIIRQLIEKRDLKKKLREEKLERRKNMNVNASDYKF